MSEADTPTNGPELPSPTDVTSANSASTEFNPEPAALPSDRLEPESVIEEDWQTVDFPNAISIDAIAQPFAEPVGEPFVEVEATYVAQPEPESSVPAESLVSLSLPEVNEIVTIMQELQQRNGYLLNRVTQLEIVLNECQVTLEAQATRTQEQEAVLTQQSEELMAADEHIARLMHELECSHQAAQRQQILVETITAQLENSQERVAQLERECALTQQRYNEQTHALMEAENICRDLRSRLHRQQRYTLQFKAALEKCLDVSSPCHEAHPDLTAASVVPPTKARSTAKTPTNSDPAFLPKVDSIQPWSAEPWLVNADLDGEGAFVSSGASLPTTAADATFSDWSGLGAESDEDSLLELPPAIAPILQDLLATPPTETPETDAINANRPLWEQAIADSQAQLSISYNLKQKLAAAEAAEGSTANSTAPETPPVTGLAEDDFSSAIELESEPEFSDEPEAIAPPYALEWEEDLPEELADSASPEPTPAEEATTALTFGVDIHEEEELWQDLAKLIDVSETAASSAARSQVEAAAQTHNESATTSSSRAIANAEATSSGFSFSSSWPSPTLYPLRSHKKRSSMAAVELPSFPQSRS